MAKRGRKPADPNKLADDMVAALESLLTKGMTTEAMALRAFIQWQGKAHNESVKTNQRIIDDLQTRIEEAEGRTDG